MVPAAVDVYRYVSFSEECSTAILEEKSTWQLTDDLPKISDATPFYPLYSAAVQVIYILNHIIAELANTTLRACNNLFKRAVNMIVELDRLV